MIKKIILTLVTLAWLYVLFTPFGTSPRFGKLLIASTSPLKMDGVSTNNEQWKVNPYGTATLKYDSVGVPHIFAETENAAAFAIGWAQANDRMFQVEMMQRTILGKLSEVAGNVALKRDLFWRKFEFEKLSQEWEISFKKLDPVEYAKFEAFSAGYNAYLKNMPIQKLPIEFHLLDFKPSLISPKTMYLLVRYMAYTLAYDPVDVQFSATKQLFASDSLLNIYFPFSSPVVQPIYPQLQPSVEQFFGADAKHSSVAIQSKMPNIDQPIITDYKQLGSNNWAIGKQKSSLGYPILCNDTHLEIAYPGTWYEMHVVVNKEYRHGLGIAGSPYIVSGFNKNVSWGMTNATWDLVDFFVLKWVDSTTYLVDDKLMKISTFTDTIQIKGAKPFIKTWQKSAFGPLDSINGKYLAVRWLGTEPSFEALAFSKLEKAKNTKEAKLAFDHFWLPPQNFVFADIQGNIGMVTAGYSALKQNAIRGVIEANSLKDIAKYQLMQNVLHHENPTEDFVFSANSNQVNSDFAAHLGYRFAPSHRSRRISQFLSQNKKFTENDLMQLHGDVLDLDWDLLKPLIAEKLTNSELNRFLTNFDGHFDTTSIQATVFYAFKQQVLEVFSTAIHKELPLWPLDEVVYSLCAKNDSLLNANGEYFSVQDCLSKAATEVFVLLEKELGPNRANWNWGKYHKASFEHIAKIPALSPKPIGTPGNSRTVNVSSGKNYTHGPSMRTIISMKPSGAEAKMIIAGGQSGRFNSKNFTDQVEPWLQVNYRNVALPTSYDQGNYQTTISLDAILN